MKLLKIGAVTFVALSLSLSGCSSGSGSATEPNADSLAAVSDPNGELSASNPYHMMDVAFENSPGEAKIKSLVDGILEMYKMPVTNENAMGVGNMAVTLRKKSVVGFTEMDLLKHIFQNGSTSITLPEQAAISSVMLDKTK